MKFLRKFKRPKAYERLALWVTRAQVRQRLRRHGAWPLCFVWAVLLAVCQRTALGQFVEVSLTQPFLFNVRERLHRDPPLNPRLKILSYDDGSIDMLQRPDLTIGDWATVLASLAERKPRAIYIDKVFSILNDSAKEAVWALPKLASLPVPVYVGAFANEAGVASRAALDLSADAYRFDSLVADQSDRPPNFTQYSGWHVYGPHPELKDIFHAGHILYWGNGAVSAFLQPESNVIVPHATLMGERRTFLRGELYVNGIRVPLTRDGQVLVNFSREDAYYDRHKRLGKAVLKARRGEPQTYIEEGDTVLVLPEMYTGSTDFKATPIGIVPAGFVLASMLNSVLSDAWLGQLPLPELQILAFCFLGVFWGSRKALRYWLGMLVLSSLVVGLGVYLFAADGIEPPLPLHLVAFWGTSLIVFADRNMKREREARRVADELNDAAEIAKAFRPDDAPTWDYCDIATYHRSFSEASGDWYAFCRGPGQRFHHFLLCDVTGHGVQAALMVSICKTVLALYTRDRQGALDSSDFLVTYARELNSMLYYHGRGRHLTTMIGITFDALTGEAHFLSAGHPPPVICRDNGKGGKSVRHLAMRSSMLGLKEDLAPKLNPCVLAPGEEVIAYTDGLPIGHHVRALNQFLGSPQVPFAGGPEALLDAIWAAEKRKTGRTLDDDVSIVWFRVKSQAAAVTAPEAPPAQPPAAAGVG